MLIVELTYKKPLSEVEKYLEAHRNFLQTYYDKKLFLASGPKNPRDGGVIIAVTDQDTMHKIIEKDPFYQYELATYKLIEFEPVKHCAELSALI